MIATVALNCDRSATRFAISIMGLTCTDISDRGQARWDQSQPLTLRHN